MHKFFTLLLSSMTVITFAMIGNTSAKAEPSNKAVKTASIVGSWVAVKPATVREGGMTVQFSANEMTYFADGTSSGSSQFELLNAPVPQDLTRYRLKGNSVWRVSNGLLTSKGTSLHVSPISASAGAQHIASSLQSQMSGAPAAKSKILKLDQNTLILKSTKTGVTLEYRRK